MNLFAQYRQNQYSDYQDELTEQYREELIINEAIRETEDMFPKWKKDLQEYFSGEYYLELTESMFDECREDYLENPETFYHLDDWSGFINYSISYLENNFLED